MLKRCILLIFLWGPFFKNIFLHLCTFHSAVFVVICNYIVLRNYYIQVPGYPVPTAVPSRMNLSFTQGPAQLNVPFGTTRRDSRIRNFFSVRWFEVSAQLYFRFSPQGPGL